jgi:RNA polymerase sigma-70 factor (ECF subfamily)
VYSVARRLTGNAADAEDLTQETYVRALSASRSFQVGTNLKSWLLTILRNINRNLTRDRTRDIVVIDTEALQRCDDADTLSDTPEERLLRNAQISDLREALDSLPPALRQIVWLRDIEGSSYAEIARRLHVPIGTVMSRLSRARDLLYRRITEKASAGPRRRSQRRPG